MDDSARVRLIDLANDLAMAALPTGKVAIRGREPEYLARFRAAYRHLAFTVDSAWSQNEADDMSALESKES
jgi:hypothetical protein